MIQPLHLALQLVCRLLHAFSGRESQLPGGGRHIAGRRAQEQARVQRPFQRGQAPARCGLVDLQQRGRARSVPLR